MPRPKKPINYDEEIQKIDMQITKWKNTIKELEDDKSILLRRKREAELASLYEAIQSSGRTVEDVISAIQAS